MTANRYKQLVKSAINGVLTDSEREELRIEAEQRTLVVYAELGSGDEND